LVGLGVRSFCTLRDWEQGRTEPDQPARASSLATPSASVASCTPLLQPPEHLDSDESDLWYRHQLCAKASKTFCTGPARDSEPHRTCGVDS